MSQFDEYKRQWEQETGKKGTAENKDELVKYIEGRMAQQPQEPVAPTNPQPTGTEQPTNTTPTASRSVYEQPKSAYETARQEMYARPEAPSEADIRKQEIERANALIEATKASYLADLQKIQQQGKERMAGTSSMAVGAGLAGSPFQQQQEIKTGEYNAQIENARKAERQAQIAAIMNDADAKAEQKWQSRRAEYESDRDSYLGFLKETQDNARNTITNIARSGLSIEDMDDAQYKKLLEDSGLSDLEARALFNLENPKTEARYEMQNGKLVQYYFDPQTGKTMINTQEIPGMEEQTGSAEIQSYGGVPYVVTQNPDGSISGKILEGFQQPEEKRNTKVVTANGRSILIDMDTGEEIKDIGYAYKGGGSSSGGSSSGTSSNAWDWAKEFISLNPDASTKDLEVELRSNPKAKGLSDSDIKLLLSEDESVDTGSQYDLEGLASQLYENYKRSEIDAELNKYDLSPAEIEMVKSYIQDKRTFWNKVLPGGK